DGTSMVALSVSSSRTPWSFATVSPILTRTFSTSPPLMPSPRLGILNSVAMSLRDRGVLLVGVDAEILHRQLHHLGVDLLLFEKCRQGGEDDELGVDLEVIPQRRAALAAAEAVGAEQVHRARQPAVDAAGQDLH